MQLIYGFVYYFLLFFVALTFCLIIFALKPARRLLQHIQVKYNSILENVWFTYLINFSFAVILLIMIDSIRAFYSISQSMGTRIIFFMKMTKGNLPLECKDSTC